MTADFTAAARQRRRLLGRGLALLPGWPLLALAGCASPWPEVPAGAGSRSALQRLRASATAHGLADWLGLQDVNLSLNGTWWPPAGLLPDVPDRPDAPGGLHLRLLPASGLMAMKAALASDRRQVLYPSTASGPVADAVRLWIDGRPSADAAARRAAALAADLHRLLLLGPIALATHPGPVHWAEPQTLDGRRCDHLHLALRPGLGGAPTDRLSLFIDREQGWLRKLRVSLDALDAASNRPIEVDLAGHRRLHGVVWPTRWQAAAPGALPGRPPQRWRLTGLDVNRGYGADDLARSPWAGRATAAAPPLPPA